MIADDFTSVGPGLQICSIILEVEDMNYTEMLSSLESDCEKNKPKQC